MPFAARQQRTKIPVTIITGFLGAGKTTLLNYLLRERGSKSIAVVENEFGEVNVDSVLVTDNLLEKEDLISLENGCICCSLRKDIVKAFAEIETRSSLREKPVDAIIMETTGLADPAPVAFTFFSNPWVASRFKLDSIMCVVDARYLIQHLGDTKAEGAINEAVQQIAFSDVIILNKIDLVTQEERSDVLTAVRRINATARVLESQLNDPKQCPPLDKLLGVSSFSIERALEVDPNFLQSDSEDEQQAAVQSSSHETAVTAHAVSASEQETASASASAGTPAADEKYNVQHAGSKRSQPEASCAGRDSKEHATADRHPKRNRKKLHDLSDVSSVGITARGALDEYRLNMFMRDLLAEKAKDIFRCKGILSIHGYDSQKFVFQGVHETICYGPCDKNFAADEQKLNHFVFIGRGLNRKALIEGFRSCMWVPLPEGWQEFKDPRTNLVFYCNRKTGEKSWKHPGEIAAAHTVTATHASTEQPPNRLPRQVLSS